MDYRKLYNDLYASGRYITDSQSSHLWDARYPVESLGLFIEELPYQTVLDVGCGIGNGLRYLMAQGKDVKGIDISDVAVEKAKANGYDVRQGSITEIPFEDNSFDMVVSTDVLEHLPEGLVEEAIIELSRIAKKYIGVKIATSPERGSVELMKNFPQYDIENLHLTVKTSHWWETLFDCTPGLWQLTKKARLHPEFGFIHTILVYEVIQ